MKKNSVGNDELMEKKDNGFKPKQNRNFGKEGNNMNRNIDRYDGQYGRRWTDRRNVAGNKKWQTNNKFVYRDRKEDERKDKGIEVQDKCNVEDNGMGETRNKLV
ncbi:hypothetical protein Tco_0326470 [Tanacetum coccineum]